MPSKYTKPGLRERIKREVLASSDGAEPGKWSARKSQLVAKRYKEAGGGYRSGGMDDTQKSLKRWTKQKWRTNSGKPSLETGERYLPDAAWKNLTPAEKAATNRAKREGMKEGKQFIRNTPAAQKAGKRARQSR